MKPLAFILYDSRSGSTLLAALLNRHAGVSVSLESAFVSRILDYGRPVRDRTDAESLARYLFEEVQFRELGFRFEEVAEVITRSAGAGGLRESIAALIGMCFQDRASTAEVWVVKHPPIQYLDVLQRMFPGTRYIHIVRDGRAVFNSKRSSRSVSGKPMQTSLVQAAMSWRRTLKAVRRTGIDVVELRYEDLVSDPERTIERLLDDLCISEAGRVVVRSQSDYFAQIGDAQSHLHSRVGGMPDPRRVDEWRRKLDSEDVAVYEALNGRYLKEYGYDLTVPTTGRNAGSAFRALARAGRHVASFGRQKVMNAVGAAFTAERRDRIRRRYVRLAYRLGRSVQ